MENKNPFDTSFIPQQPVIKIESAKRTGEINIPMIVAAVIFFATLIAAGGLYFWRTSVEARVVQKEAELAGKADQIDIDGIKELQRVEARLTTGKRLLLNHVAFTAFLAFLESETLKSVTFNSLDYSVRDGAPHVVLKGKAPTYMSLYVQEQSFKQNPLVKSVVTSGVSLLPVTGNVGFDVDLTLDPNGIKYVEEVNKGESQQGTTTSSISSTSMMSRVSDPSGGGGPPTP